MRGTAALRPQRASRARAARRASSSTTTPLVYDELLAKFIRDFANDFPPEVIATMRTGVFGADGQRPSSLMGYVKLAQQLEKALAGEVRIVFEPVKK